jgi:hypothetical protein
MKKYKVTGIDCPMCAAKIESDLEELGIKAKCSYAKCELIVEDKDEELIKKVLKENCCELQEERKK